MSSTTLRFLSYKTSFLLAFASAAGVSELHAIDNSSIRFSKDKKEVSCRALQEFLAKNQSTSAGPLGTRSYRIPALPTSTSRSDKRDCYVQSGV